jgi:hypothetical protein
MEAEGGEGGGTKKVSRGRDLIFFSAGDLSYGISLVCMLSEEKQAVLRYLFYF